MDKNTRQNKEQDRWLRKWSDENGELDAVIRERGKYWLRSTVPAWEPGAGKRTFTRLSLEHAQQIDRDESGELIYTENEQAKIEHDPFFTNFTKEG